MTGRLEIRRQLSLLQLLTLMGIIAFAFALAVAPLQIRILGYLLSIAVTLLPAEVFRGRSRMYVVGSLAGMFSLLFLILLIAYARNEQPFNMNYVASDKAISVARVVVVPFGIILGATASFVLRVKEENGKEKGTGVD